MKETLRIFEQKIAKDAKKQNRFPCFALFASFC